MSVMSTQDKFIVDVIDSKISVMSTQDKLIVSLHSKMSAVICRAVSEMRKGLSEGDGGFDLALAKKKE